jgi:hypothetical protein
MLTGLLYKGYLLHSLYNVLVRRAMGFRDFLQKLPLRAGKGDTCPIPVNIDISFPYQITPNGKIAENRIL